MENDGEASTSQPPEPGRGAGGKMRRSPNRNPRPTPYARPNSNKPQAGGGGGGGWLSKLVDPVYRLISGSATRILPSLFSRSPFPVSLPPLPGDDNDDPTMKKVMNLPASSYEVFLNFRGQDTRHEFTDFLYDGMVKARIHVFRDNESLHVGQRIGDELLQAIQNSKIYVPIFSKNYASSHWCLRELAHMVKCASESNGNKEILPIFLDVEPDDVKLKTNLYSKALSKHQKKFRTEVESWREALIKVDEIKGWNWGKHEGQAKLTESVIETVLRKLNVDNKRIVTKQLVGVDDRVEDIIKMLDVRSDSVQFLGIHGMGGIGKTTLAKVIFNRLSSSFHGCKFLSDVAESSRESSRHGLVDLQKQLLSKFIDDRRIYEDIDDVEDGIKMIKRFLSSRKVLIVLDDVDDKRQLNSLAKEGDWFGSGSRIIITTRDQSVLRTVGEATTEGLAKNSTKVSTYEVSQMDFEDALKLFSKHAFRRDFPLDHYAALSKEIVSTLGMLPLALEVIGSYLVDKPEESWETTSNELKHALFDEVESNLMISYKKLNDSQKEVFLDIACFFVNKDKKYPFYMWDAYGYNHLRVIEELFLKSLIKINDDDTFWMHDQVRDLGRNIVRKENHDDPCERSRVWNHEDARSILKEREESKKIKALSVGFPRLLPKDIILKYYNFAGLRMLRFLELVYFAGDLNNLPSRLRWLSCRGAFKFEAKNFNPDNLVVLDLSGSNFSEESIDWIKEARKLKVLNLTYCFKLSRISDLSTLVHLEILILRDFRQIKELPDSIGNLQSLIELDLMGTGIDHLPDSFGNLKQLKTLRMLDIEEGLTKLPNAVWLVQTVIDPQWFPKDAWPLSCLKMPDLPWTQISGLPTVASLVSNILKVELAGQGSGGFRDHEEGSLDLLRDLDPLRDLENVFFFPDELGQTHSQVEKQLLASPIIRFLDQLPPSSREEVFRELTTTYLQDLDSRPDLCCWMLIFLGVRDSESEKLLMQECTISRRLAYLTMREWEEGSTPPGSPQP